MPSASIWHLLPEPYHQFLAIDELKEYYPLDFEIDLNGKTTPWEAVILIPFVDENVIIWIENELRDAGKLKLSAKEQERNVDGISRQFKWSEKEG